MRVSYTEDSAQQKDHLTDKERELQLFDPSYSNSAPGPPNDATFETIKDATLVTKEINEHDPSFYNCIYGIPDSVQQVGGSEEFDFKDVRIKALFCLLVLISLIVWLIVWLINRGKDKKQRQELEDANNINNQNPPNHLNIDTLESRIY
uniref:Uncharacterized protein n=1 Tax=Meloidogyne floridensis TaxID=298350 RepID=A0A915NSD8_9BILA